MCRNVGPENNILHEDLIFLRGYTGDWLTLADDDDDDDIRTMPAMFRRLENAPDSEALIILPVASRPLQNVVQLRRLSQTLIDYQKELRTLPDCQSAEASDPDHSLLVLDVVDECHSGLVKVLRTLVVNCTFDSDPNPMSRDGIPNKLMQKLLPLVLDPVGHGYRYLLKVNWSFIQPQIKTVQLWMDTHLF